MYDHESVTASSTARGYSVLLAALLLLYILAGSLYVVIDPALEASDEINHYPFVQLLASGGDLPVQRPGIATMWGQEGSQPPLYYQLAAVLTRWIDASDLGSLWQLNPHSERGIPLAHDNKNMIVHSARESFPWHGATLALHLARFFSLILGAGTVWCTAILTRKLFPSRPWLALAAASLNAFIPMFLFISASVNNDNLVTFLAAIALVLIIDVLGRPASIRRSIGLGVVCGLAALSKLSGLGLLPLSALATTVALWRACPRQPGWVRTLFGKWATHMVALGLPALIVSGWWYLRNWQLYGELTGMNMMLAVAGRRPIPPPLGELIGEFGGFRINFWGLFGAVNVLMRPDAVYKLLDVITLIALAGLVVLVARRRGILLSALRGRDMGTQIYGLFVLALWTTIVFAALVRWTSLTAASQGRLMFPTLPALCLFMVLGLSVWIPQRLRRTVGSVLVALLFLLAVTAPFTAILPAYAVPSPISRTEISSSARPANVAFGEGVRLLSFEVDREQVRPGDEVKVTLYWECLEAMREDFSVYVQIFGWHQDLGQRDSYPGRGGAPTSVWRKGEIRRDEFWVPIRSDAKGPAPIWLSAGLYRFQGREKLPATDLEGKPVVFPVLTRLNLAVPQPNLLPTKPQRAAFEQGVNFLGSDVWPPVIRAGSTVSVTLFWQPAQPLAIDRHVFLQLVDGAGKQWANSDGLALQGFLLPSAWRAGEIINDERLLNLPKDIPPGEYRLVTGWYDPKSGGRLNVLDAAGNPSGNSLTFGPIKVSQ
jgi:hypothetical protein